jgi:hypothetical protein
MMGLFLISEYPKLSSIKKTCFLKADSPKKALNGLPISKWAFEPIKALWA